MPQQEQLMEQVVEFIRNHGNLHDIVITGDSKLVLDIGLNSYELLTMCCELEEELNMEINEADMMKIVTVNDVVRYLKKR